MAKSYAEYADDNEVRKYKSSIRLLFWGKTSESTESMKSRNTDDDNAKEIQHKRHIIRKKYHGGDIYSNATIPATTTTAYRSPQQHIAMVTAVPRSLHALLVSK